MKLLTFLFAILVTSIDQHHHHHKWVLANYGDYVDPTFNCPAKTTCPIVCVPYGTACPASLACSPGTTLCLDGTCESNCTAANAAFDRFASPCPSCMPVVCPTIVNSYDQCKDNYHIYYNLTSQCKAHQSLKEYTLLEAPFVIVYVIVTLIGLSLFLWCAFNQRWAAVPGSTQPLLSVYNENMIDDSAAAAAAAAAAATAWTQTGYMGGSSLLGWRKNPIGMFLYLSMILLLFTLNILLAILTYWYYKRPITSAGTKAIFQDDVNLLQVFEITWIVAFGLTFILKWPTTILSLYLRRSLLEYATHVAIYTPIQQESSVEGNSGIETISKILTCLSSCFHRGMQTLLSDVHTPQGDVTYCTVHQENNGTRYITFRLRRYVYDNKTGRFEPGSVDVGRTFGDFIQQRHGIDSTQVLATRRIVGPNSIDIRKPFILRTILQEFSKPFYTYQLYMIWAWFPFNYYFMAIVQSTIILSGGLSVSFFVYRNERNLYRLSKVSGHVRVLRDTALVTTPQEELIPGDVVRVQPGLVYADMIVLSTDVILVDESALTGESTPMAKSAIDPAESQIVFQPTLHKKHFLSAGTTCIEVAADSFALVLKTGSYTAKGELLRDVLSFRRHKFKFDTQVQLVVLILACYGLIGFLMTIHYYDDHFAYEFFYGIYVVETAIPPLLPTVFTVSVGISDDRLARKRIACSNSEGILVAGRVDRAFFDKTGTLTKQGLDFVSASCTVSTENTSKVSSEETITGDLQIAMATCHTLTVSQKGMLIGNQVDINMFQSVDASIISKEEDKETKIHLFDGRSYTVLKRFDFDHHRMTMSVIIQDKNGAIFAFVKGSGESIKKCCVPSTMPANFDASLEQSAKEGIYQISIAMKPLPDNMISKLATIPRDEVECNLSFVGVVNFKNVLREETPAVIQELWEGGVKPIILTGDSVLTGICIARESGIIKTDEAVLLGKSVSASGGVEWYDDNDKKVSAPTVESLRHGGIALAVTSTVWESMLASSREDALAIGDYIRVFGRCTPNNKADIITAYVDKGHICCMAGDGGNDCGALKTAHVGVALSDAEASTVASFTSLDKSVTSVVEVLKEGRCALASAFASYKYMIMYGQIESMNQLMNAYFQVTFSEWCWVFMDGVWMITMAFTLPIARAQKKLSPSRPTSDLLGWHTVSSALGVLILNFTFTIIALATLFGSSFFQCRKWNSSDISNVTTIGDNYEAELLFLVTGYQYISSAMAFNFGYSYRANWFRNWIFVTLVTIYTVIHWVVIIHPGKMSCLWRVNCTNDHVVRGITGGPTPVPINNPFNTTVMPEYFRWILVGIIVGNTIAIMSWEYFVVNGIFSRLSTKRLRPSSSSFLPPDNSPSSSLVV